MTHAARFRIRRAEPEDIDEILALDRTCFPLDTAPDTREHVAWWLVEECSGAQPVAVGYAAAQVSAQYTGVVYLSRVGVLPEARGCGLQRRLIRAREAWARRQGCTHCRTDTAPHNVASQRSLIRCGYLPFAPRIPWAGQGYIYWIRRLTPCAVHT